MMQGSIHFIIVWVVKIDFIIILSNIITILVVVEASFCMYSALVRISRKRKEVSVVPIVRVV